MNKYKDYEQSIETAYWLLRNTVLTFRQIADFCDLNPLEIAQIENTSGKIKKTGYNPVLYQEITQDDVIRCEQDPSERLPKPQEMKKKRKSKISKENEELIAKAKKIVEKPSTLQNTKDINLDSKTKEQSVINKKEDKKLADNTKVKKVPAVKIIKTKNEAVVKTQKAPAKAKIVLTKTASADKDIKSKTKDSTTTAKAKTAVKTSKTKVSKEKK